MPFFSSKFSPKKVPTRKSDISIISKELGVEFASRELGLDIPQAKVTLGDNELVFEDGRWVLESRSTYKENSKLRKTLKALEEENNMLKLKFEILLEMLTQTTAECQMQLKEIGELRKNIESNMTLSRNKRS